MAGLDPAIPKALSQRLKLGALLRVSVRRIKPAMASACSYQHEFSRAYARLKRPAT